MLTELHIEGLGLIDRLDLVLGDGLTVLTGETGAGKSMLLDAIELLIGGRADPIVVRAGMTEARVEGRFVNDDEEFVVARVVPVEGRSRAYVNGRLATAANLAELGAPPGRSPRPARPPEPARYRGAARRARPVRPGRSPALARGPGPAGRDRGSDGHARGRRPDAGP